jgi:hypothetical protein
VDDPIKVQLKVSKVYSQHIAQRSKQLLVLSQHGTQLLVHSQHGAPTCVMHKPRPEKYFEKSHHFFFRNKQSLLFPTAIFILSFTFSHVSQHGAQPVGTNPVNKNPCKFFFFLKKNLNQ